MKILVMSMIALGLTGSIAHAQTRQ
jgi:hypothetical protein